VYQSVAPTISSFTPARGSRFGDTVVRIQGTGLFGQTRVFFGSQEVPRANVTVVSSTTLDVLSPAQAPGTVKIAVQNPGGAQAQSASSYTYEAFTVGAVTPSSGSVCGGARVKLVGTSFHPGVTVTFGDRPAADVTVVSEYELSVVTPEVPEGTGQVATKVSYGGFTLTGPSFAFRSVEFIRGDANGDGVVSRADPELILSFIHGTAPLGAPLDAADADDSGIVNVVDAQFLYLYFYSQGAAPPAPFPSAGQDPTPDSLVGCSGP
jgi:hypothetical protein